MNEQEIRKRWFEIEDEIARLNKEKRELNKEASLLYPHQVGEIVIYEKTKLVKIVDYPFSKYKESTVSGLAVITRIAPRFHSFDDKIEFLVEIHPITKSGKVSQNCIHAVNIVKFTGDIHEDYKKQQ